MSKGAWRKQFQWKIEPVQLVNKKFTGLHNPAATCYQNSLLQQLFFIKSFTNPLMQIDSDLIPDKQNIVRQIQNIFGFLKFSENPHYNTVSLCRNFILDGQPIDPRIQMDIDQFFHALMDKLQTNLNKINKTEIINEIFRGQFSNLIIGQQCPHVSQRIQHFLSIRLQIKNKKTLYQAFQQFIKGQMLEGQNLYFCQKCDKKVKALKRVCLKDLPNVLIITLKRFQFNFDTMQKFKLNSYCSFPQNINLLPYTKQGIQQAQQSKQSNTTANNSQNLQTKLSIQNNQQNYEYKLKGVVIHYGISQAGHYTSYIRTDTKNQWNYFDDQRISQFNLNNLEKQCFGGIQENPFGDDQQKKKNAYLLIYQKIKKRQETRGKVQEKQSQVQAQYQQKQLEILKKTKVYSLVQQDNLKNKSINVLFQSNIQNYIYNSSEKNPTIFLIYYHNVFLRNAKKYDKYNEFYQKSIQLLSNKQVSKWYLSQINQSFLLEFVIHGQYQAKHIIVSLICYSMKKVFDKQFILQCIGLLYTKNIIPFVKIFAQASLIPEYAKQLNTNNLGDVIYNMIKGNQVKQNSIINKVQIRKEILAFGLAASGFIEMKKYDTKDLFRAIQSMKININFEELKSFAVQVKNPKIQRSLALITARRFKDLDSFSKFIQNQFTSQLITYQINRCGDESYYNYLLLVVQQLLKIKDNDQQKRCIHLIKIYIEAIKQSINSFKSQLMLLTYLFKLWYTNPMFRQVLFNFINQNKQIKKILLLLKQWLKQSQTLIPNINNQKWSWWRKIKKIYPGLTQQQVAKQIKLPIKQSLSLLNSIIQKQNLQLKSEFIQNGDLAYYLDKNYDIPQHIKVLRKFGMLVQIQDSQGNKRYISQDDLVKKFI